MGFFFLALFILNVLLVLSLAVALTWSGDDRRLRSLLGLSDLSDPDAAFARRRRIDAEENAWRFE
ncbi:MAG: hypothetical protein AAGG56_00475 [Pseudomonadota bacterium]